MKRTLIAAAGLALVAACGVANAASWSVFVEPGVYGRVAIGGYLTAPVVFDEQPVVAVDPGAPAPLVEYDDGGVPVYAPPAHDPPPVYMWVPQWQRLHWADACREYGACGVPVYFVRDDWYRTNVMGRAWTPEQRGWTQAQWIEQDRIARERWERQRWDREQGWRQQQPWRVEQARSPEQWQREPQRAQEPANRDRARDERERADVDRQARERADRDQPDSPRWQQQHGPIVQPVAAWQPGQRAQPVYDGGNGRGARGAYEQHPGGYVDR